VPLELIYTSAPRGLKAGSSGYCTVAQTRGMREDLAAALERRSLFAHEATGECPIYFSYRNLSVGGTTWRVLSRGLDAGLDFTGRRHYLVHHLVLDSADDLPGLQPADLLLGWGGWLDEWTSSPETRTQLRAEDFRGPIPGARLPAREWKRITGDAGWAALPHRLASPVGWLAQNLSSAEMLSLMAESAALLEKKHPGKSWTVPLDAGGPANPIPKDCWWVGRTPWRLGGVPAGVRSVLRIEECRGRAPEGQDEEILLARTGRGNLPSPATAIRPGPDAGRPVVPEASESRPRPNRDRRRLLVSALAVMLVGLGGGIFWGWDRSGEVSEREEESLAKPESELQPEPVAQVEPPISPEVPESVSPGRSLAQMLWAEAGGRESIEGLLFLSGKPASAGVIGEEVRLLLRGAEGVGAVRGPDGPILLETEEQRKSFCREAAKRMGPWTLFVPGTARGLAYLPDPSTGAMERRVMAQGRSPGEILEEVSRSVFLPPEQWSLLIRFPASGEKEFMPVRILAQDEEDLWQDRVGQHRAQLRRMWGEALRRLAPGLNGDPETWDEKKIQALVGRARAAEGFSPMVDDFRKLDSEVRRWRLPATALAPGEVFRHLLGQPGVVCELQLDELAIGRLAP